MVSSRLILFLDPLCGHPVDDGIATRIKCANEN